VTLEDARDWVNRLGGVLVGLAAGLAWSLKITGGLVKLGARMGTHVLQGARLAAEVSRYFQSSTQRLERDENRIGNLEQEVFGKRGPVEDEERIDLGLRRK
jgi:hypothetical protein